MNSTFDDPIAYIQDILLEDNGIQMSSTTINLILTYFNDFKYNLLINGYPLLEKNICTLVPVVRYMSRNHSMGGDKKPPYLLPKFNTKLDPGLRKALAQRVINSEEVRKRLRPDDYQNISDTDLQCLKEMYVDKVKR